MKIPIVLICDDNYIIPTSVAISSMISSKAPETYYEIYIVCASLSEESEAAFSVFASDSVAIHILREDAERFASLHTFSEASMCVASVSALLKFVLPELLPQYDKVIYLDGDLLVRTDLSELYSTELEDNMVAAVIDSSLLYSEREILFQVEHYFNSGVMLLNLNQMRTEGMAEILIQAKRESTDQSLMDQNVLNIVFDHRVKCLPIWYNFLAINLERAKDKWDLENLNRLYGTEFQTQEELFDSWKILHFSSKDKPWKNPFVLFADRWFDIYRSIPVSHTLPDYPTILQNAVITVSLTSYPERIHCVPEVIDCLMTQTILPNRVILYLAKEQFPRRDEELPERLLEQATQGQVEIHWCDLDLKSHKKYYYAMQEYPDDLIITVDDDEYLPETAIQQLMLSWLHFPNAISANRTHLITFSRDGSVLPYRQWVSEYKEVVLIPSMQLMGTGCCGILYPPHLLPDTIFDVQGIMETALYGDDLWLKAHAAMSDIPTVLSTKRCSLHHIEGTQQIGLHKKNVSQDGNDVQFLKICDYIDRCYGGTNLLQDKLFTSDVGINLSETEKLTELIVKLKNVVRSKNNKLQQTYAEKSEINRKLQITYGEKFDRGVQIRELKAQLKAAKKAQADLKKQLNQTNKQLKASKKQNTAIKRSTSYRLGRILTWPVRRLKRLWKRLKRQ